MSYSDRMQRSHLYSVFFAPRGMARMADLGMQIAQQYLSPFDLLIGLVGVAGSGKSMLIKGMFPGLELSNDDGGVNVRPLPLLSAAEENTGFYAPHTYHVDIRFEAAFMQLHELADAITEAITLGKRVIVEHFELVRPFLAINAQLLIGIGEEIIITRPTMFGPEPKEITDIVFKSIDSRRRIHSAEDVTMLCLRRQGVTRSDYLHADVRHGFILGFFDEPDIDLDMLTSDVEEVISRDSGIKYLDDHHILIGDERCQCAGPRLHVKSASCIGPFTLNKELLREPITNRHLLVGVVGDQTREKIGNLNKIVSA